MPNNNDKGRLSSKFKDLVGVTIRDVGTVPAEVTRQCKQYAMIQGVDTNGNPIRLLFVMAEVKAACPDHGDMLDDMIDGTDFWELAEIRARQRGQALLKSDTGGVPIKEKV